MSGKRKEGKKYPKNRCESCHKLSDDVIYGPNPFLAEIEKRFYSCLVM